MVKVRTVVDRGSLGGCASENLWLPGVEMGVKVDDRDGSVCFVHGAQKRQRDSVVSTEGNDARKCLAVFAGASHVCVCGGLAHEDAVVALFDLLESPLVVVTCHGDITTVDDSGPAIERVRCNSN